MSDVTKTPKEDLECKNKYLYEYSMFWECKEHSKNQILEEDVCDLLNKFSSEIEELNISISLFEDDIATKDKKINEQQAIIDQLNLAIDDLLSHTSCDEIKKENEQLRQEVIIYKKAFQEQVQRCSL